jgi:hypothetical protein
VAEMKIEGVGVNKKQRSDVERELKIDQGNDDISASYASGRRRSLED